MNAQVKSDQYQRRKAETRQRLRDAMERLKAGNPQSARVRGRKWKLDVKTVAEEAGVSRNAIYQNHSEIIEELRNAGEASPAGRQASHTAEVKRLKQALQRAGEEHQLLARDNAELLARALHAERELNELRSHQQRLSGG